MMREPNIPAPVAPKRPPAVSFPAGATDCHAHVFGPQSRYPLLADTHFVPHVTPWHDYAAMLVSIGCDRAVLVQPSVYGTDNSAIEHAFAAAGAFELRAVAVVAPDVSDRELERLHGIGFRGIRINVAAPTRGLRLEHAQQLAPRIRDLGWHLQFYADFHMQPEAADVLASLNIPIVIDHFAKVPAEQGVGSSGFKTLLRLLARENCWAKLSAPYLTSHSLPGFDDLVPFANAMIAVAPDRIVWGTDWPHPSARERMPADAELADILAQWVPDELARRRVLVDNPSRLYGFAN